MNNANTGGQFDALLGEIEVLAKSSPADESGDATIAAAAAEGAEAGAEAEGEKDEDAEGETLGKSFEVELEDGTKVPAVDGTVLVKSLMARVEANEGKVLGAVTGLLSIVKTQGELIKSQAAELAAFGAAGKGRKAILAITEKPAPAAETLAKSDPDASGGISGEEFMAKAMGAQAAGRLTGREIAEAESHINMGLQPPAHIIRAVLAQ